MMGKRRFSVVFLLFGMIIGIMISAGKAEAAGIKNLKENREYKFNLDGKGKKERLSYSMTSEGIYKININGKTVEQIKLESYYYSPKMQILDINKKDKKLDIWVYAYAGSMDISYAALYEYSNKQIKRIWNQKFGNRGCGFIISTNGKGKFTVVMEGTEVFLLTGNHFNKVNFRLKNGKVKQLSDKTYYFYKTFGSGGVNAKDRGLITAGQTIFYKGHSKSSKTFVLNKGVKCYPKKMYIEGNKRAWVLFKTKNGRKGWLCTDDFSYSRHPFLDMVFGD